MLTACRSIHDCGSGLGIVSTVAAAGGLQLVQNGSLRAPGSHAEATLGVGKDDFVALTVRDGAIEIGVGWSPALISEIE